jgi:hypothetical protein
MSYDYTARELWDKAYQDSRIYWKLRERMVTLESLQKERPWLPEEREEHYHLEAVTLKYESILNSTTIGCLAWTAATRKDEVIMFRSHLPSIFWLKDPQDRFDLCSWWRYVKLGREKRMKT